MPYLIEKIGRVYRVINPITGKIHSKGTTLTKAKKQIKLMHMIDHLRFLPY
jgi:hypothetical protein